MPPKQVSLPWPSNYVGGICYALAKELQLLNGGPETALLADLLPSDTTAQVISTFGLPSSGTLLGAGKEIKYTAKTAYTLTLDVDDPQYPKSFSIPKGTILVLKPYSVLPDRYTWDPGETTPYP
jgi:hypothetical protein